MSPCILWARYGVEASRSKTEKATQSNPNAAGTRPCCSVKRGRIMSPFLCVNGLRHNHWGPCNLHCICMMHVGSCHASNECNELTRVVHSADTYFRPISLSLFLTSTLVGFVIIFCWCVAVGSPRVHAGKLRLHVPKSRANCKSQS